MSEELKACPFCGGKPKMHTSNQNDPFAVLAWADITCYECRAQIESRGCQGEAKDLAQSVIERWNKRAPNV